LLYELIAAGVFFAALIAGLIDFARWAADAHPLSETDMRCAEIDRQLDREGK
jgi:hypothetical protein